MKILKNNKISLILIKNLKNKIILNILILYIIIYKN